MRAHFAEVRLVSFEQRILAHDERPEPDGSSPAPDGEEVDGRWVHGHRRGLADGKYALHAFRDEELGRMAVLRNFVFIEIQREGFRVGLVVVIHDDL